MDDELKVVITTVLEADESASAKRIAQQLPEISRLVNARSSIKIQVGIDQNVLRSEAQKIGKTLNTAAKHQIGVTLNLDNNSVNRLRTELESLRVNPDITSAMTEQLDKMGIQIDKVSGRWIQAAESEERLLSLTIQGKDQLGRIVSLVQTYKEGEDQVDTAVTSVTQNLEKQRKLEEQIAAKQKADNEDRLSYLQKQAILLSKIQSEYSGKTSAKAITDESHLQSLQNLYQGISNDISVLRHQSGELEKADRSRIEGTIALLQMMVKEYQNVEYVATKLRTKTVVQVNSEQVERLNEYEEKLRSAGILTKEFEGKIATLRTELASAFDSKSLTAYLNSFDRLQSDVDSFEQKIRSVNALYTQLQGVAKKINALQERLNKTDPINQPGDYTALQQQLALHQGIKSQLEAQLVPYGELVNYASRKAAYEQQQEILAGQLNISEAQLADKAREIDEKMRGVPASVEALRASFNQLTAPTQTLVERMSMLDTLMANVTNASSEKMKIAAYKQLSDTISECKKEISALNRVQRVEVIDSRFNSNLQKAKADLETIRRTWSQFTHDRGLNAQFEQLQANLARVRSQTDLTKWTAQFSAFKSEVRAAGMNMQSLGDILKNNVGKVLQWVSATTLLFRAFRLVRSAISTIVDLDTAIVDLRKTTDETAASYQRYYEAANETAKRLGATTEEIISQTAEWTRLGYSMQDAAKMAENSAIFAAISPGMDLSSATDGLVSVMKAYGYEAEDVLDGIMSKINSVGNAFAVSNKDIVETLTRSSSAMAAANNTFEETVALATAAIEITRDAASVGNGLKTLSMRIRGYDEETEEYSEDIAMLTGTIADLTKTASRPGGISLFEKDDPETYRSTYDILSDISEIWDELTDKNRATLLEALFGKRQAQIGSAILTNFGQARKSISTMEKSAGHAEREMSKIMDSLEYKINALKETWTGVAQNLFEREDLKLIVEALISLSDVIDTITDKLGLFGSVTLVGLIGYIRQFSTSLTAINTSVIPALQSLNGLTFDGTTASMIRYIEAMEGLDYAQKKLLLDMAGLNAEQQKQIMDMAAAIAVIQQYTVAEVESTLGLEAGTIAKRLNVSANTMMTESLLKAALANGALTESQVASIAATSTQTTAINAATTATKGYTFAAMKMAAVSMLSNPFGWITILVGVLPLAINLIKKLGNSQQEAYDVADQLLSKYKETDTELRDLSKEVADTTSRIDELKQLSRDGKITLIEQEELERLQHINTELATTVKRKEELAARQAEESDSAFENAFNKERFRSIYADTLVTEMQSLYEEFGDSIQKYLLFDIGIEWEPDELEKVAEAAARVQQITRALEIGYDSATGQWTDQTETFEEHVRSLVTEYQKLTEIQESGLELTDSQSDLLYRVRSELVDLAGKLDDDYIGKYVADDEVKALWQELLDLINKNIYAATYFTEKLKELPTECYDELERLGSASALTEKRVLELAGAFPELKHWMEESGNTAADVAANFNALGRSSDDGTQRIDELQRKLESLKGELVDLSNHSGNVDLIGRNRVVINDSNMEKVKGWGMSDAEIGDYMTVASQTVIDKNTAIVITPILPNGELLSQDELDNYISSVITRTTDGDYAANDNLGIIMGVFGDSDSLAENLANAEHFAESVHTIHEEITQTAMDLSSILERQNEALESENAELSRSNALLMEQRSSIEGRRDIFEVSGRLDDWQKAIDKVNSSIEDNNKAISKNAGVISDNMLSIRESLDLAGELKNLADPWADVIDVFDRCESAMESLASIQEAVAESFTISAEKAREFAEMYPQILNNAQFSADGQVTLNEEVVNSFIAGKQAELQADVEAEISKLEAEKAALEAKKASAEAQLELVKNVGEGEGQIAKEVAEYRLNVNNALTQALIDNGVSEAEAYALVAAAMAKDEEEFARVAMGAFQNMDENAAKAAYSMAQNILINAQNSAQSIADIAKQAHETAKAIAAMGDGEIAGSDAVVGVGGGGAGGGGVSLDLYHGDFKGAEADYSAAKVSLDDYVSQLELDISAYTDAIAQIDGQIATLRAIGSKSLDDYISGSGSGGGGGGGGSTKEIEEYIASIEDYREALKRLAEARLAVSQLEERIDNSDNLKEQILLQRELIKAEAEQQAALHNLNNQRDSTIHAGVKALQELGFEVEYNDEMNKLWIANMEHLNELTAGNAGEYETLQEATNALREETEELIEQITDLNDANQEASEEWWDLKYATQAAKDEIQNLLKEIVEQASDAVDSIQSVYDALHAAADEYAESGYITVDTLQSIIDLGMEYVSYLYDENGQLIINEERIRDVIAARTEQLAIESSLSYVEALRIAHEENDLDTLNRLLTATESATDATWELVYANLQLIGLSDDQYTAALNNINAIRALADNAIHHIGEVGKSASDELKELKSGLDDILKYVMEMLKQRINDQIDALEEMKDAYSEIIDQKKESIKADKEAVSYQKTLSKKMREMAQLQAQIDALSLDDSREAQAQRAKLVEKLGELQEEVSDKQSDHMVDAMEDALDKMEDEYHSEKDKEIKILEDSISSYQKLYDMAIEYIGSHWDTLYNELIDWNTEYGNVLNSEITSAWDNCLAAAQRYGSYVSALNNIDADITAASTAGTNTVVGNTYYSDKASNTDMVKAIVSQMKAYAAQWKTTNSQSLNDSLHEKAVLEAAKLDQYGVHVDFDSESGYWKIVKDELNPSNIGKYLYQCYHSGGIVGGGDAKSNEQFALLKKDEWVLNENMVKNLTDRMENVERLNSLVQQKWGNALNAPTLDDFVRPSSKSLNDIVNSTSTVITIGDTNIYGSNNDTVQQHIVVNRKLVNQIANLMNLKR